MPKRKTRKRIDKITVFGVRIMQINCAGDREECRCREVYLKKSVSNSHGSANRKRFIICVHFEWKGSGTSKHCAYFIVRNDRKNIYLKNILLFGVFFFSLILFWDFWIRFLNEKKKLRRTGSSAEIGMK